MGDGQSHVFFHFSHFFIFYFHFPSSSFIFLHVLSFSFIFFHILSFSVIVFHVLSFSSSFSFSFSSVKLRLNTMHNPKMTTPRYIQSNNKHHTQRTTLRRFTKTSSQPETNMTVIRKVNPPKPVKQAKSTQSTVKNGPIDGVKGLNDVSDHETDPHPHQIEPPPQCLE